MSLGLNFREKKLSNNLTYIVLMGLEFFTLTSRQIVTLGHSQTVGGNACPVEYGRMNIGVLQSAHHWGGSAAAATGEFLSTHTAPYEVWWDQLIKVTCCFRLTSVSDCS